MTREEWKKTKQIILKEIQDLINFFDNKNKWCRKALARDKDGEALPNPFMEEATCFCLMGAVYYLEISDDTISLLNRGALSNNFNDIIDLNDKTSYEDVRNFLKIILKSIKKI